MVQKVPKVAPAVMPTGVKRGRSSSRMSTGLAYDGDAAEGPESSAPAAESGDAAEGLEPSEAFHR